MMVWRLTSFTSVVLWSLHAQNAVFAHQAITVSEPLRIVVERDSFICASVKVSAEIWPPDRWEIKEGTGLSGLLVNGLRNEFIKAEKLGKATRFRTHDNDRDPVCSDEASIYINVAYEGKEDGLFSAAVDVEHGSVKRRSVHEVNVAEEMNSGRLVILQGQNKVKRAIAADIKRIAREIVADNLHLE